MRIGLLSLKAGTSAGGLATYELYLVRAIAAADRENEYHVFCVDPVRPESFGIDQENVIFHRMRPRNRAVCMSLSVPLALRRGVDLFHVSYLPPLWSGLPYVFTAHGPEMFVDPKFFPFLIRIRLLPLIRRCYRGARALLCVSDNTRSYVTENYPATRDRARVVYNGCLDLFRPQPPESIPPVLRERYGIECPYVLFVGRVEPHNPQRMLEAYHIFRERTGGAVKLVMVGAQTWSARKAVDTIDRLGLHDDVISLGHVEHEDLPIVYAGASMFVFPSLWEGFGLPLIEAMRCGTPTITSDVSCLPEVSGGISLLVDPRSPESIAAAMVRVHEDEGLRAELIRKGHARGAEFSWDRTARECIEAYRDVYASLTAEPARREA